MCLLVDRQTIVVEAFNEALEIFKEKNKPTRGEKNNLFKLVWGDRVLSTLGRSGTYVEPGKARVPVDIDDKPDEE